jgi:hypothetical protein
VLTCLTKCGLVRAPDLLLACPALSTLMHFSPLETVTLARNGSEARRRLVRAAYVPGIVPSTATARNSAVPRSVMAALVRQP